MDYYIQHLQHLHWTAWSALGLSLAWGLILLGMRLWDAWKGHSPGTLYDKQFRRPRQEKATSKTTKVLISDAAAEAEPVTGRLLECSVSTVSLGVADSVDAGTILSFRPIDLPAAFGWASVEVKEASKANGHWKLGCRFIRTPPWVTRFLGQPVA